MLQSKNRFTIIFVIGSVILIFGLALSWYSSSVISGMSETLRQGGLSQDQQNKYNGALASWNLWQITMFNPVSSILSVIGVIVIIYAIIQKIFSIASNNNIDKTQNSSG